MKLTEVSIWKSIKDGDERSFKLLFDQHYQPLCYTAYRIVQDQEVAKDMAQDAFVELWNKRQNLDIDFSIWGYLKRTAINKSLNYIKANKRTISLTIQHSDLDIPQKSMVNSDLERQEIVQLVQDQINKLPGRCREIFILRRYEQMSYRQIAEALSISERTVEVQLRKARITLLRTLRPYKDYVSIILILWSTWT